MADNAYKTVGQTTHRDNQPIENFDKSYFN
jgi:hypothetical protein